MRRLPALVAAVVTVALVGSGCASQGAPPFRPPRTSVELPAGQVVFQVEAGGGMEPSFIAIARRPALTVYGDGRTFTVEESRAFTGAPTGLAEGTIDPATLRTLMGNALVSGLFADADFGDPQITDVGGTTLAFRPNPGHAERASAYALGYRDAESRLTDTQRHNRQALRTLIHALFDAIRPGDSGEYLPAQVDVVEPTTRVGDAPATAKQWPGPELDGLLTHERSSNRCGVLSGDAARGAYLAARQNSSINWTVNGQSRQLIVRALLPGERGCAD